MGNKHYSPLRYPGGKTKLAPFIKSLFYENKLVGSHYVEPYAGGAGVALSMLFDEYVQSITINDYDRSVYAFWHSIVFNTDAFCNKIIEIPVTIETWHQQKRIQKNKDSNNLLILGFSTFFLNRTNISGVIKGGVIGGLKQQGEYKINARFNKHNLIEKIQKIGEYRNRIQITNQDALEVLKHCKEENFVYLDPPYVKKAKDLYMNFYKEENHREIADFLLCNQDSFHWLLSYDENELIRNFYKSCNTHLSWNLGYGSSNTKGREYIFIKKGINITKSKEFLS